MSDQDLQDGGGFVTFGCDETNKLADAFLHALLGLLCNLCVFWKGGFHDPGNWRIVTNVSVRITLMMVPDLRSARRLWGLGRGSVGHDRMYDRGETTRDQVIVLRAQ